jgi:hypothetical protein
MSNRRAPSPNAPAGAFPDVLADLRQQGHLTQRQFSAGTLFLRDLQASHGQSAGLVSNIAERIDAGRRPALRPPGGPSIALLDQRLNRLHPHERDLLKVLVTVREKPRGTLTDYARTRSAYNTQRDQRTFGVARVTGLLDSLADLYMPVDRGVV